MNKLVPTNWVEILYTIWIGNGIERWEHLRTERTKKMEEIDRTQWTKECWQILLVGNACTHCASELFLSSSQRKWRRWNTLVIWFRFSFGNECPIFHLKDEPYIFVKNDHMIIITFMFIMVHAVHKTDDIIVFRNAQYMCPVWRCCDSFIESGSYDLFFQLGILAPFFIQKWSLYFWFK